MNGQWSPHTSDNDNSNGVHNQAGRQWETSSTTWSRDSVWSFCDGLVSIVPPSLQWILELCSKKYFTREEVARQSNPYIGWLSNWPRSARQFLNALYCVQYYLWVMDSKHRIASLVYNLSDFVPIATAALVSEWIGSLVSVSNSFAGQKQLNFLSSFLDTEWCSSEKPLLLRYHFIYLSSEFKIYHRRLVSFSKNAVLF